MVGGHQADARRAGASRRETTPREASTVSTARTTAGTTPVCPTMSGFAKFTTQNACAAVERRGDLRRDL